MFLYFSLLSLAIGSVYPPVLYLVHTCFTGEIQIQSCSCTLRLGQVFFLDLTFHFFARVFVAEIRSLQRKNERRKSFGWNEWWPVGILYKSVTATPLRMIILPRSRLRTTEAPLKGGTNFHQ